MRLTQTIPALPVRDVEVAAPFYRDRLGFAIRYQDTGFAVVARDEAELHLWQSDDETWRDRTVDGSVMDGEKVDSPVQSGAESFIAGTASCRIRVDDVDGLYDELRGTSVLHYVSAGGVTDTDFGSREFATTDQDGNLISFFRWDPPPA